MQLKCLIFDDVLFSYLSLHTTKSAHNKITVVYSARNSVIKYTTSVPISLESSHETHTNDFDAIP